MNLCDACRTRPALFHVTLVVCFFGPRQERQKRVHFWLCEACEQSSRQVLRRDELQGERLAYRLVEAPAPSSRRNSSA